MKFIVFKGGLGNQIFQYAYCKFLLEKFPEDNLYGFFPKIGLNTHNGLEISRVFDVELPTEIRFLSPILLFLFRLNNLCIRHNVSIPFISTDSFFKEDVLIYDGYWQNQKFLTNFELNFRCLNLNNNNDKYLNLIKNNNSVSVHIRRGDYLSSDNLYKICTKDYYDSAINYIKSKIDNPFFFFFSDDPQWVMDNFIENQMCVVLGNTAANSFIDLFLMTHCKAHIIANSTFSYWGAYLSKTSKITIYPNEWYNYGIETPDIAKENWISL